METSNKTRAWTCLNVGVALLLLGLPASHAAAEGFVWTGGCGINDDWYATCLGDPAIQCSWNPDKWETWNNWGHMGCDSPAFPGPGDNVTIGSGFVELRQGDATIQNLTIGSTLEVREDRTLTVNGDLVNSGVLYPSGGSIWNSLVTVNGNFTNTATGYVEAQHGGTLAIAGGSIVNHGTIKLRHNTGMGHGRLRLDNDLTLSGTGDLLCGADIFSDSDITLTNAAGHTIHHGSGEILVALVNNGLVNADRDDANTVLAIKGGEGANNGTMKATNGCSLDIYSIVNQGPNGLIFADGGTVRLRGTTIVGGTLDSTDSSIITTLDQTLNHVSDITNEGYLRVPTDRSALAVSGTTLNNNGTIELCCDPTMPGKMRVDSDVTLDGTGELLLGWDVYTESGHTLTNGANHTIRYGNGSIRVRLVNNGTVNADRDEQFKPLSLMDAEVVNNAVMKATNNGFLDISTTVNQSPNGRIVADGGTVRLRCATIVGGTLASTDGSTIETAKRANSLCGTTYLANVTNEAYLNVLNNDSLLVISGDSLVNNGTIELWPNSPMYGPGEMRLDADLSLSGTGEVYCRSRIYSDTGKMLTNEAGHTIRGTGKIEVAMINHGTVWADYPGHPMAVNPNETDITNDGVMIADPDCWLSIKAEHFTQVAGKIIANGRVTAYGAPLDLQGGSLTGDGVVSGDVDNASGTVSPGNTVGKLEIDDWLSASASDYVQGATGTLFIELAGTTQDTEYDRLHVTGTATLDGELHVEPIDGYLPQVGDRFTILTANTVTGQFATVTGPGEYDVTYNANNVTITVLVMPNTDCNDNGVPDDQDIADGTSEDCDGNDLPDECQTDSDGDGRIDPCDDCPNDPSKTEAGTCGCGVSDADSDGDGTPDCNDDCPNDPNKTFPGDCGCGVPDDDTDGDGTPDCNEGCPNDPDKTESGDCGCGVSDVDSDGDGLPDCNDGCPNDPNKTEPGDCGCSEANPHSGGDDVADCPDDYPVIHGTDQADDDADGIGDPGTPAPTPVPFGLCGFGFGGATVSAMLPLAWMGLGHLKRRRHHYYRRRT
ncbi:MAG: hypothetical protein JXQ75_13725 [Phycisphaerae bacterium]|nr:hypothetical protein [Phycisphaerae bacterium]